MESKVIFFGIDKDGLCFKLCIYNRGILSVLAGQEGNDIKFAGIVLVRPIDGR